MNSHNRKHFAIFISFLFVLTASFLFAEDQAQKDGRSAMEKKLQTIFLPTVALKQVSFPEALETIRKQSRLYDPEEDPEKKDVNFILKGAAEADRTITLMLTNVSLGDALRLLSSLAGYSMKIEKQGIVFETAERNNQ